MDSHNNIYSWSSLRVFGFLSTGSYNVFSGNRTLVGSKSTNATHVNDYFKFGIVDHIRSRHELQTLFWLN